MLTLCLDDLGKNMALKSKNMPRCPNCDHEQVQLLNMESPISAWRWKCRMCKHPFKMEDKMPTNHPIHPHHYWPQHPVTTAVEKRPPGWTTDWLAIQGRGGATLYWVAPNGDRFTLDGTQVGEDLAPLNHRRPPDWTPKWRDMGRHIYRRPDGTYIRWVVAPTGHDSLVIPTDEELIEMQRRGELPSDEELEREDMVERTDFETCFSVPRNAVNEGLMTINDARKSVIRMSPKPATATFSGFDGWRNRAVTAEAELKKLRASLKQAHDDIVEAEAGFLKARQERDEWKATALTAGRLLAMVPPDEKPGDHDYIGPTQPAIDPATGQTVKRPVPDKVHERFHQSIGDVLAGKIMPEARRQMREAIDKAPVYPVTTDATTKAPMPGQAVHMTHVGIGLRLP